MAGDDLESLSGGEGSRAQRARRDASLAIGGSLVALLCCAAVVTLAYPYWNPEAYLPDVKRTAEPTIAAIDAYIARVGYPPESLHDLLPEYDAARAGTGYPRQSEFFYRTWKKPKRGPDNEWTLILWTDWIALESDEIQYESGTRSWRLVNGH